MSDTDNKQLIIRKSNELIEARYKLTLAEQRLVLLVASEISPDDMDFKQYKISVADFAKMFELESCNSLYEKVQNAANSLVGKTLQLSTDDTICEMTTWLSYVKYVKGSGLIHLEFHRSLKPYLLQLKSHYTQYDMNQVIDFTSQYSIRFYELLKMDAFKAKDGRFVKAFEMEHLRLILGLEEKDYPFFKDFRKRVIDTAIKEINEKADIFIENVSYGKTVRKITRATFSVVVRSKEETLKKQAHPDDGAVEPGSHPVIEKLIELGFSGALAKTYKNKHGVKKIERNIAYTLAKKQEGLVKDVPAYLNKAIEADLGGAWAITTQKGTEKTRRLEKMAQEKQAAEDQAKQEVGRHYKKAFAAYQALPEAKKAVLKEAFIGEADPTMAGLIKKAQSQGKELFASPLISSGFKKFLIDRKGF
jgi:hypothetical protein